MKESTPPGSQLCGQYTSFDRDCVGKCGGHIRQKEPMQVGFSGHNLQGICLNAAKNVKMGKTDIQNMESLYGLTYGISIWPSVDIVFEEEVTISNLLAGVDYDELFGDDEDDEKEISSPNRIPEVCGIRVVEEYYSDTADKIYKSEVTFRDGTDQNDVLIANIDGYKTCYVDSSADDYYDDYWSHEVDTDRKPKYSMIGIWHGHSADFKGIGKYGIMAKQSSLQQKTGSHERSRRKKGLLNVYWVEHNLRNVIIGAVIVFVIVLAVVTQACCSKYILQDRKFVAHGGRIMFLGNTNSKSKQSKESTPLLSPWNSNICEISMMD